MSKSRIPFSTLVACAEAAFLATERHYNGYAMADLSMQPNHVRDRVIKDVQAVLIGDVNAEVLHNAWAHRKYIASGYSFDKLKSKYPTATVDFGFLTAEDQSGYNLFIDTVKRTYNDLHGTVDTSGLKPVKITKAVEFAEVIRKAHSGCLEYTGENWVVSFKFKSAKDAQDCFNKSGNVS